MAQKRKCYAASCPTNVGESTTDFGFVPPERMTSAQLATAGEVTLLFWCNFFFCSRSPFCGPPAWRNSVPLAPLLMTCLFNAFAGVEDGGHIHVSVPACRAWKGPDSEREALISPSSQATMGICSSTSASARSQCFRWEGRC